MKTTEKVKKHRAGRRTLTIMAIFLILVIAANHIYAVIPMKTLDNALRLTEEPSAGVTVMKEGRMTAFVPESEILAGVVIYPGCRINSEAYAPIADALAQKGYLCVLVRMPFHLTYYAMNAAMKVQKQWPAVDSWYIAGHSMGGWGAEVCAYGHQDVFDGVILLGARQRHDFSQSDLPVLTVYATEDGLCSPEYVSRAKVPDPKYGTRVYIEGGCHEYFGSYEGQSWDGTPTITREEQQSQVIDAMLDFLAD